MSEVAANADVTALSPQGGGELCIADVALHADCAGALYWPEPGLLAVADLHLEKGSSYARRGVFLPPYDSAATLAALARLITQYAPRCVVALGDNFHDGEGAQRLPDGDRDNLRALQRGRDWIWITGNHDPEPADGIGGAFVASLTVGDITFRHHPTARSAAGEIAGHLHPVARVSHRGRTVGRRCFAANDKQAIMPAFGAYTGGLNVRDAAFAAVFGTLAFSAHMLGDGRLYSFTAKHCIRD